MEAEYLALSEAMKDLIPLKNKLEELARNLKMGDPDITEICRTEVHEDNMGCLKLAQMEPGRMTPRSKHYAVHYHWFCSKLDSKMVMKHIETAHQRANMLTKSLRSGPFQKERLLTTGW